MSVRSLRHIATALTVTTGLLLAACGAESEPLASRGADPPTSANDTTTTRGNEASTTTELTVAADDTVFSGGDFYATPPSSSQIHGDQSHGDLIHVQPMELQAMDGVVAWRILYWSQTIADDKPIAVSGMVFAPDEPAATPRPLVAWAHGTVGSADVCAPSRNFTGHPRTDKIEEATTIQQLAALVDRGYVVVASDYEGLGTEGPHPFLVGESEGRGVLDSMLAVRQMDQIDTSEHAVIYGLSQGGQAALFAGEMATEWAPSITVAGVVAAAPFSEVELLLPLAAQIPSVFFYYVMGVYGQAAANPALQVDDVLDPVAIAQQALLEAECITTLPAKFEALAASAGKSTFMVTDPTKLADWGPQLESIRPGQAPTEAPILIVQGSLDPTVPAATTHVLVKRICQIDQVTFKEYADIGHGAVIQAANEDILAFIDDRLAGRAVPTTC